MKQYGGQTILTSAEEEFIVQSILYASDCGLPFGKEEVKGLLKGYLDRSGRKIKLFKNNKPGDDWYYRFLIRNATVLKPRLGENIKR